MGFISRVLHTRISSVTQHFRSVHLEGFLVSSRVIFGHLYFPRKSLSSRRSKVCFLQSCTPQSLRIPENTSASPGSLRPFPAARPYVFCLFSLFTRLARFLSLTHCLLFCLGSPPAWGLMYRFIGGSKSPTTRDWCPRHKPEEEEGSGDRPSPASV